jgi:hypothetical protein
MAVVRHAAAFLLLPLMAWAQVPASEPPPAAVDQALRARVTEFLQDFVDGQFRKALKFVAEESQDLYFASSKAELKDFKIDDIKYDADFQRATVFFTTNREWTVHFEGLSKVPIQVQMSSTWKIEDGQWAWYYKAEGEPWITAMGKSDAELISRKLDGTVQVPQVINQDTANSAADKILRQSDIDKSSLRLLSDKASSDKIVFHNAVNGQVSIELLDLPKLPGFHIDVDKPALNAGEDAVIEAHYDPPADRDPDVHIQGFRFTINIHPFEQVFLIQVDFQAPALVSAPDKN